MNINNHFKLSLAKSILRILGSVLSIVVAAISSYIEGLIILSSSYGIAELLGILEEILDPRK